MVMPSEMATALSSAEGRADQWGRPGGGMPQGKEWERVYPELCLQLRTILEEHEPVLVACRRLRMTLQAPGRKIGEAQAKAFYPPKRSAGELRERHEAPVPVAQSLLACLATRLPSGSGHLLVVAALDTIIKLQQLMGSLCQNFLEMSSGLTC